MSYTPDVFVIGTIKMLAQLGQTEKIVELCNEWLDKFEPAQQTMNTEQWYELLSNWAEVLDFELSYKVKIMFAENLAKWHAAQQSVQPTGGTVAPANIDQRPEVNSAGENNQRPATSG